MSTITFTVTNRATDPNRLDTEQVYALNRFTNLKILQPSFNRTYARSMDRRSGRGTLIADSQEMMIDFIIPISEQADFNELVYSLADYQICTIDATDRTHLADTYEVRMLGDAFTRDLKGCNNVSGTLTFEIIP